MWYGLDHLPIDRAAVESVFNDPKRIIKQTRLGASVLVSTVFLVIDHAFTVGEHVPLLYETAALDGPEDLMRRFPTKDQALKCHDVFVTYLKDTYPEQCRPRWFHRLSR